MSFSKDMERLQAIVEEVESDEITMEESLALFEEGVGLIKRCRDYLMEAKRKITLLSGDEELPWEPGEPAKNAEGGGGR